MYQGFLNRYLILTLLSSFIHKDAFPLNANSSMVNAKELAKNVANAVNCGIIKKGRDAFTCHVDQHMHILCSIPGTPRPAETLNTVENIWKASWLLPAY